MVLMAAGIILISSLSAAFYYQMDSIEDAEIENRAGKIAGVINELDVSSQDRVRQILTFDDQSSGIYLPPKIRDEPYTIEITTGYVRVKKGDKSSLKDLRADVHLWNPEDLNETGVLEESEEGWRDSRTESMKIQAGECDIELMMLNLEDDRTSENHVFVQEVDTS